MEILKINEKNCVCFTLYGILIDFVGSIIEYQITVNLSSIYFAFLKKKVAFCDSLDLSACSYQSRISFNIRIVYLYYLYNSIIFFTIYFSFTPNHDHNRNILINYSDYIGVYEFPKCFVNHRFYLNTKS